MVIFAADMVAFVIWLPAMFVIARPRKAEKCADWLMEKVLRRYAENPDTRLPTRIRGWDYIPGDMAEFNRFLGSAFHHSCERVGWTRIVGILYLAVSVGMVAFIWSSN